MPSAQKSSNRNQFKHLLRCCYLQSNRIQHLIGNRAVSGGGQITKAGTPEHIKANWPGCIWIVEMVTTTTRSGRQHRNQTSSVPHQHPHHARRPAASDPPALEQLLLFEKASPTQPGGYENEWHWARDTQLREDAHRYRETNGVQTMATLKSQTMNAVRLDGFWSITEGLAALAHDSRGLLPLLGWGEPPQAQNSA